MWSVRASPAQASKAVSRVHRNFSGGSKGRRGDGERLLRVRHALRLPWHPRLSERLGLFRYIECAGSHEAWFTQPAALAQAIAEAGRD